MTKNLDPCAMTKIWILVLCPKIRIFVLWQKVQFLLCFYLKSNSHVMAKKLDPCAMIKNLDPCAITKNPDPLALTNNLDPRAMAKIRIIVLWPKLDNKKFGLKRFLLSVAKNKHWSESGGKKYGPGSTNIDTEIKQERASLLREDICIQEIQFS